MVRYCTCRPLVPPSYACRSLTLSLSRSLASDYNVYSKPLFGEKAAKSVYRPRGNDDAFGNADEQFNKLKNTSRFKPEKDFEGVCACLSLCGHVLCGDNRTVYSFFVLSQTGCFLA